MLSSTDLASPAMIYAVLLLLPVALQAAVDDQGAGAFNLTPDGVKTADPRRYLSACRENARRGANCNSYSCYTRNHDVDLRQLDSLSCREDGDCYPDDTAMRCVKYGQDRGFCECQRHSAYNVTACRCQKAELCSHKVADAGRRGEMAMVANCFNGMVCSDASCSCGDLSATLFEPSTRFCVEPRTGDYKDEMFKDADNRIVIVVAVIAAFVFLAVASILVFVLTDRCSRKSSSSSSSASSSSGSPPSPVVACCSLADCFDRGEYECDEADRDHRGRVVRRGRGGGGGDNGEVEAHVAAWELPSLDYLSEEQTMKYLRTHHNRGYVQESDTDGTSGEDAIEVVGQELQDGPAPVASSETTSSSSSSSSSSSGRTSSLPESDRQQQERQQQHDNRAYVHDEGGGGRGGVSGKIV